MQALFSSSRHHETFPIRLLTTSAPTSKFKVLLVHINRVTLIPYKQGTFYFSLENKLLRVVPANKSNNFFERNFKSSYFLSDQNSIFSYGLIWKYLTSYLLYSMTLLVNNLFRHFYHFLKNVSHLYQTRARSKIDKNLILLVNTQFNSYCRTIGLTFQIKGHAMALFRNKKNIQTRSCNHFEKCYNVTKGFTDQNRLVQDQD